MLKNRTILSLDQRIEVLWGLGEAHHVERLLPSQCGKTQMACMISKQTRKATVAYVEYKHSRTVGLKYLSCCINFRFTTIAYIIMTMRILIAWTYVIHNRRQTSTIPSPTSCKQIDSAGCSSGKTALQTCHPLSKWDWRWPSLCRLDLERTGSAGELLTDCAQGLAVRKQR